jgi:hypothetical protein
VEWIRKRVIEVLKGRERRERLVVERGGVVESESEGRSMSKSKSRSENEEKNERVCVWGREKEREGISALIYNDISK